ncbi:cytochrome b/b6 domain-containing protein [Methylobrevis pamukkalensis]|uniref:Putative Ni/Fe-hydrogenase B-type cytochrome subunit n=1 Tax=Methylobrevis pamukkalensis TaxID=1439726 RepID=A0A1E3GXD7_9HYPH|nr:cytochrome b/b6 domain-containing protein [Methylobrevis pamukkalensis]ODN68674.1 putative Ni/Fe-hydrogenase B-type cytochrome subunit [Methylobrevis pamukkalensis]
MTGADLEIGRGEGAQPSSGRVRATAPAAGAPTGSVKVWDPVVRLFHWTVVAGCLLNLFILEEGKSAHRITGYVILGALAIRLVWGFIGSRHARFADFFPTRRRLSGHVWELMAGQEVRRLGHPPLASVMLLTLMALLAVTGLTGWMTTLDAFWGETWLETLHEVFANAIMVLAFVHAGAAIVQSVRHRENLVWAMVTGRKRA